MSVQIALFNHKGGVSKTTTCFNLGWMLADKGKRVLLVDCDPQCNLTGMFMGFRGQDEIEKVYEGTGIKNIKDGLAPAFESKPIPLAPVICQEIERQPNLLLLPGHIGLAEFETTLGIAQELSGSLVTLQNLPGAMSRLFQLTAEANKIDIILIDMSPSLGAINQNLVATSDYFIVPMAPDYFSLMALDSLASVLPKWKEWAVRAKGIKALQDATYPLPKCDPKFMGTIIQKYRLREGNTPSAAFQDWIDEIQKRIKGKLLPVLRQSNMVLEDDLFTKAQLDITNPLLQMSEFNGLIAMSQKHNSPVYALTDEQLGQTGIVLARTKKSMARFEELFSEGADRIISLVC